MIKGIIFDLDGTLIDSMNVWTNVDKDFVEKYGGEYTSDISQKLKSTTIEQSAEMFIDLLKLDLSVKEVSEYIENMVAYQYENVIPLKPNALDIFDMLDKKNVPYCIATATYRKLAKNILSRFNIYDRFFTVITGEDVSIGKTSPDIYFECAKAMNLEPSEILVLEDSLHCIKTAVNAGFYTVGIYDDFNKADWSEITSIANETVMDLTQFSSILKKGFVFK